MEDDGVSGIGDEINPVEDQQELEFADLEENLEGDEMEEEGKDSSFAIPPPSRLSRADEAMRWDFREGVLPPGIEVIGGEPQFQLQRDGSTALYLPPMCFLKISFDSQPSSLRSGFGGKLINDYTLTIDLFLERLPAQSMSLFQCSGDARKTEGESFIYSTGGVGIFGEIGSPDASIRPNRWSRIVVTLGSELLPPKSSKNVLRSNKELNYAEEEKFQAFARSSEYRTNNRVLNTYVNSKKCASISSSTRGVLNVTDGRFAANTEGITICGSNNPEAMNTGKLIKFIEFRRQAMSESSIRREGYNNRIFSIWEKERKAELKERQNHLRLKPIYKNPPPIWMHPTLGAMFGDSFLEGTGLEGGDLATSSSAFEVVLDHLLKSLLNCQTVSEETNEGGDEKKQDPEFQSQDSIDLIFTDFCFTHDDRQTLNYIFECIKKLKLLCRKYELAKKNGAPQLVHYFKLLKKYLGNLQEGETLVLPGGIGESVVIYVVEREDINKFRLSVVNTNPLFGLDWHLCDPSSSPPHIKYQTVLTVSNITQKKFDDDAFWGILLQLAIIPSKENSPDKLYDLLLPYLVDKPIDQIVSESENDPDFEFRYPQKSNTPSVRCLVETIHYLLKRHHISDKTRLKIMYSIETQWVEFIKHDLQFIQSLGNNERKILEMCYSEFSSRSSDLGSKDILSIQQLNQALHLVQELKRTIELLPGSETDAEQPTVDLIDSETLSSEDISATLLFPLCDRLRRPDDVNGLAGPPVVLPRYVPIDMLQIPISVKSMKDVIEAIRYCDRLCTLISVQQHCVKNRSFLKFSLIEHTFIQVLPCPKSSRAPDFQACVWQAPMSYSCQIDICICLGRIMEHFISSAYSLYPTKSLDALKLTITGCIAAMIDVTLRHVSTDQPSEFCLHYIGQRGGGLGQGFGISMASFDTQSETIELHTPELTIARANILDYFYEQKSLKKIFNWDQGHHLDEPTAEFVTQIASWLAFPTDPKSIIGYITTHNQLINKNYPEFHILRDIAFYVKYVQNVDPRAFPPQREYTQMAVELSWSYDQGMFMVEAFARNFLLKCYPDPPFVGTKSRYPSAALPSNLASPHTIQTEDDVLHIKNLPSFDGCLGQQDSEQLLSYLTVPYLRIPLILALFTTEDRIHALKSEELQNTLNSVLFEPDRFLYSDVVGEPVEVPVRSKEHLATVFGLLWNEIHRSPEMFIDCVIKLLTLSIDLDVGTFHSQTVSIILYVIRLVSRIESYLSFFLSCGQNQDLLLRSVDFSLATLDIIQNGVTKIRSILRGKLHTMLEAWAAELSHDCEILETQNDLIIDENTRSACQLHAHILLLYRNLSPIEYTLESASCITSSFMFLTTRHTWNLNLLGIPEHEIFEMLAVQRRNLILWTRSQSQCTLNELMESTIRVTANTGGRVKEKNPTAPNATNIWAFIEGERSIGRFSVASTRRLGTQDIIEATPIQTIPSNVELGIEIDLQTVQLTLKSSHLKALDTKIANDKDVQTIFGKKSMQGSIVESTVNRTCINLIGRGHNIQHWQTPDERSCIQNFDREYSAGELFPSEEWIVPIFEPVRLTYMTRPFVLQICLPEDPLSPEADVACLIGIHPKSGGTWKEIFVHKTLKMVQVFNVLSHGRRFYRVLEYTTNCKYSFREMQPPLDDRSAPWPEWERYGSGHPYADHWNNPITCVITRGWDYEQNLSGGEETYLPPRLFYGIIPQSLLDQYTFWQDEIDNIRGYPKDKSSPYFIYIELIDTLLPSMSVFGTGARIHRLLRHPVESRMKKQMDLLKIIDNAHFVEEKDWKVDFKLLSRLGKIVDFGCDSEEINNFIEALKTSCVIYSQLDDLLVEIETFASEQAQPNMEIVSQNLKKRDALETAELSLLNWLHSPPNSKHASLMVCLSRLENIGHTLSWTTDLTFTSLSIDLVEMPRLKLNFQEKLDENNIKRLYSMDHSHLFVSNFRSSLSTRLMSGLPHSLLLASSNNELQILVPAIDLVRPRISTSPFTTELVMNRNYAKEWNNALDTPYFLYPIHVSLSFLFSPTLSSGLYLLLVRFLSRNYEDVFRLANTIGTDFEFSPEENLIFQSLGRLNSDSHPDAHACRLKISSVTLDAPIQCPWDLTRQCSRYIIKLASLSLVCRLSLEEELQLLNLCVCDSNDPRFYDSKGQPKYTVYEVTLIKNRKSYLQSLFAKSLVANVYSVPHEHGTKWPVARNLTCLMLDSDSFSTLEVTYAGPAQLSGHAVIQIMQKFWSQQEDTTGRFANLGFLFIYELFTGTKTAKYLHVDISQSLAIFLFELLSDKNEETLLPSILSILCRFPHLRELLPKYQDTRSFKNTTVKAYCDDRDPISPLGSLLQEILDILQTQISEIMADYEQWGAVPKSPPSCCVVMPQDVTNWIIPLISDYSSSKRVLTDIPIERCLTLGIPSSLSVGLADLDSFSGQPLASIDLNKFTSSSTRYDFGLPALDPAIPFDVSRHPQAQTAVARSMILRLTKDVKEYAEIQNSCSIPKCSFLRDAYQSLMDFPSNSGNLLSLQSLRLLLDELINLRDIDEKYLQSALDWLSTASNNTNGNLSEPQSFESKTRLLYLLNRVARLEAEIWPEFLFASVLSTKQYEDLTRLNPFLSHETIEIISDVIVAVVFHSNRISHINRCIKDCRELESTLSKIENLKSNPSNSDKLLKELSAALSLNDESLSRNLNTERNYVEKRQNVGGEEKRQRVEMTFDPRFLLFEFTWSLLLRKSQVQIVQEYLVNLSQGVSTVKQMIMGAGKTTVVCPLLTLMLGDGQNLVVQVVPPALLDLSRAVMRSTFSSIMHKRIFTLTFDRSSTADETLSKKLINSVNSRGVVVTTPATIKSMFLKFLEWMYILNDPNSPKSLAMEQDCQELGKILKMFRDGILIMDEVDLILHPMKSELNFPIGDRQELDYSPQRWQMPIHILDAIFYAESSRITVGFKQSSRAKEVLEVLRQTITQGYSVRALQRNPHIVLLNLEWYHSILKPKIADWLYMWIETQHMGTLSEFNVKKYLLEGANHQSNPELANLIETSISHEHKKMLNLARDWLRSFLPHILQKVDRVSFGLLNKGDYERAIQTDPHMPRTRAKLAIPFVGKDVPSKSSEFAHPDVIIGLTILAYRYEGLRWSDFEDIISNLRSTLTKEIGPYKLRKSSLIYSNWVKDAGGYIKGETTSTEYNAENEVVPLRLLKRSNEDQMKKLYSLLLSHPDTIHFYLENFIFPAHMDSKILKLSAAGQELGGEMLFSRRIGFSGTPSDLLPVELGRCGYERGSDGQMIHVMTSPTVCSFEITSLSWTPHSILSRICNAPDDFRFHALIDTGALITGMTNLEVAQYLLDHGLNWCEGVVFLDEYDRKMVLVRSTRRVLKMAQCGIPPEKRFAFYDQVHTTGMDIHHTLNACALLTLSKDMVFRDFAQGAYRMRGINKGQTIHLLIIPEVCDLIYRELYKFGRRSEIATFVEMALQQTYFSSAILLPDSVKDILVDINAWLVINSMRSERIQFHQLCLQNIANIWRKSAYKSLLEHHHIFSAHEVPSPFSSEAKSLRLFCEPINFSLEAAVPVAKPFLTSIKQRVFDHEEFVVDQCEHPVVKDILGLLESSQIDSLDEDEEDHSRLLNSEMVQEQEQEKEQQQEQEQEQEIEIEKYVDLAYSRENEEQVPWKFVSLSQNVTTFRNDHNILVSSGHPPQFYPASAFKLIKRDPLNFPHNMLVSSNYFDLKWSGARRIKNITMVLDWIPCQEKLHNLYLDLQPLSESQEQAISTALSLFAVSGKSGLTKSEFAQVLKSAGHSDLLESETFDAMFVSCNPQQNEIGEHSIPLEAVRKLLIDGHLSPITEGRRMVAISLAEAETLRRIIHIRNGKTQLPFNWHINGSDVMIALRCVPAGDILTDKSSNYSLEKDFGSFTSLSAYECFRYLNCDMYFNEKSLNILIRALANTNRRERRQFFKNVLMCRRRMNKKWMTSPVSKLFVLSDQFGMLKQRAFSVSLRHRIKEKGLMLYDAFCKFNFTRNGYLTPGEVWGGFDYLGIEATSVDVLDFFNAADTDKDGLLNFRDFIEILQDSDSVQGEAERYEFISSPTSIHSPEDLDDDRMVLVDPIPLQRQISLTPITPKGQEELENLRILYKQIEESEDLEAIKAENENDRRIIEELEAEEDEKDRQQEGGRNPLITEDQIIYNFTTGRLPRKLKVHGDISLINDDFGAFLKVLPKTRMLLPIPFLSNCGGNRLNQFTINIEVQFTPPEATKTPLSVPEDIEENDPDFGITREFKSEQPEGIFPILSFPTTGPIKSKVKNQLWADNMGNLHTFDGSCFIQSTSQLRLQRGKWHIISLIFDCIVGEMEVYLDGVCTHSKSDQSAISRLTPPDLTFDGLYSPGGEIYLFGDHLSEGKGMIAQWNIRHFSLHNRCLHHSEVSEFVTQLKRESDKGVVNMISLHLQSMGVDPQIAHWAATVSEGSTIEQRMNSALNQVYS